jgi:PBSX family phage terminase large subunit
MSKVVIELLDHQYDALSSPEKITLLNGGIGSGKSFTGALHALDMTETNPYSPGLIAANTYKQLHDATMTTLLNLLEQNKIAHHFKESKGELYIGPKMFWCRSLENYNKLRGIEISDFWLDETRDTPEDAFKVVLGRLRHPKVKRFRGLLTTSPSGYNWLHDYFVSNPRPDFDMFNASSYDNPFLPNGYIETLLGSYDPKMIDQEIHGKFLNLIAEPVYYSFDRNKNVKEFSLAEIFVDDEGNPIPEDEWPMPSIGMDFNVNPMTAVMGFATEECIYIWDEAYLKNSNTFEMKKHLLEKNYKGSRIIPDGTGKKRTSASLDGSVATDFVILEDGGNFDIKKCTNPHVADRVNCVNGLLSKARLVIHPRCVNLIKDLEQVSRGKNDEMLTHISDALGYMAWFYFPIRKITSAKTYRYM